MTLPRFITVTPNPSIDYALTVPSLVPGAVVKTTAEQLHCGGKGVNVSRLLARLGKATVALFPCGGYSGLEHMELAFREGLAIHPFMIRGSTRRNTVISATGQGGVLKVNSAGPVLEEYEWKAFLDEAVNFCGEGDWVIAGGSLPPGVDIRFYRWLAGRTRDRGTMMALDTSGPPLEVALIGGGIIRPHVVKMNLDELAELWKSPLASLETAWNQGYRFPEGSEYLVSHGPEGAMVISARGRWRAFSHRRHGGLVVGSGDSLLAGYVLKRSQGAMEMESLRFAVACATATAMAPLHQLASPQEVEACLAQVEVVSINGREKAP